MYFVSPTKGPMSFDAMYEDICLYMTEDLTPATNSSWEATHNPETTFASSLPLLSTDWAKAGYFFKVGHPSLRQRIFWLTWLRCIARLAANLK